MPNSLGQKIRAKRLLLGLSQRAAAELIGIQQPPLSRIERGEAIPSGRSLAKIAHVLGESVDFLLDSSPVAGEIETLLSELAQRMSPEHLQALSELDADGYDRLVTVLEAILHRD